MAVFVLAEIWRLPSISGCSFLHETLPVGRANKSDVSMPSISGYSFLRNQNFGMVDNSYVSMPSISGCSFLRVNVKALPRLLLLLCQCPLSRAAHFYDSFWRASVFLLYCVNALYLGLLISTLPLQKPFIYAGSRPRFCRYFSEYSDNLAKQGQKVGRDRIVFF